MIKYGAVDEHWFNTVRREAEDDLLEFDQACIPMIKMVNTLKNIATKFCCSGHPNRLSQPSLSFVVKDSPEFLITRYSEWSDEMTELDFWTMRPRLLLVKVLYPPNYASSRTLSYWLWKIDFCSNKVRSEGELKFINDQMLRFCQHLTKGDE